MFWRIELDLRIPCDNRYTIEALSEVFSTSVYMYKDLSLDLACERTTWRCGKPERT
jgi:hypothetical protein